MVEFSSDLRYSNLGAYLGDVNLLSGNAIHLAFFLGNLWNPVHLSI